MSNSYRIQFAALSDKIDTAQAANMLTSKLKLSEAKAQQFLAGKLIFSPISQDKAIKQQKTFAALGINVKIINAESNAETSKTSSYDVDERILAALDYITTSIIRLEEKVDDLTRLQQLQNGEEEPQNNTQDDWGEELAFEDERIEPNKSRKINWVFIILLIILLSLLGVVVAFPNLLPL